MRKFSLTLLLVGCVSLAGCATDPNQFSNSLNNVVDNTHTAAVATVSIGTEILRAIIALAPAVIDTFNVLLIN